jgi:hypothetical protein
MARVPGVDGVPQHRSAFLHHEPAVLQGAAQQPALAPWPLRGAGCVWCRGVSGRALPHSFPSHTLPLTRLQTRAGWMLLDPATRVATYQRLLELVQRVLEGVRVFDAATLSRLCATVATATALSGPEACDRFLQQALAIGLGGTGAGAGLAVDLVEVGDEQWRWCGWAGGAQGAARRGRGSGGGGGGRVGPAPWVLWHFHALRALRGPPHPVVPCCRRLPRRPCCGHMLTRRRSCRSSSTTCPACSRSCRACA